MIEFTEDQMEKILELQKQKGFEIIELEKKRHDMVTTFINEFWDCINKANEKAITKLKNKEIHEGF